MTTFARLFGRPAEVTVSAPGRVNLIGEHTDYNGGFVLPTPIPQRTTVELATRGDSVVRVTSANLPGEPRSYTLGEERAGGEWVDYVQGVTDVLRRSGQMIGGFDARVGSRVPIGSGVSSSAALQVALLEALRERFALRLDNLEIALLAQRAENEFVGAHVGVMDPMAASLGMEGHALFIDTRALEWRQIPIPPTIALVVIDSGVEHRNAAGGYNQRRRECEEACRRLGVPALRDLGLRDLDRLQDLPETLAKRARHVITENARVQAATAALESAWLDELGLLLRESHASLRDDYEVSVPAVDALVAALDADHDVLGARITGGGFGGAVVAACRAGSEERAARAAAARYAQRTGQSPRVLVPEAAAAVAT